MKILEYIQKEHFWVGWLCLKSDGSYIASKVGTKQTVSRWAKDKCLDDHFAHCDVFIAPINFDNISLVYEHTEGLSEVEKITNDRCSKKKLKDLMMSELQEGSPHEKL